MVEQLEFDFRLHADSASLVGTQYFELFPGRYTGSHWMRGSRFVHEYTFCLFEGVFEKRVADFDHFGFDEIEPQRWSLILKDLAVLAESLYRAGDTPVPLPYGSILNVQDSFEWNLFSNQHALAGLITELADWVHRNLGEHGCVSVMGL